MEMIIKVKDFENEGKSDDVMLANRVYFLCRLYL